MTRSRKPSAKASRAHTGRAMTAMRRSRAGRALTDRPWLGGVALAVLVVVAVLAGRIGGDSRPVEPFQVVQSQDAEPQGATAPGGPHVPRGAPPVPSSVPGSTARPPPVIQAAPPMPLAPQPAPPSEPRAPLPSVDRAPVPQVAVLPPPPPPPDGAPLWRRNAVPAPSSDGRPRVVIVIDDMGLDRRRSGRIAALQGPLTLAWLPYARDLQAQTRAARERGHELIVHVPMEPGGGENPGPDALLTRLSADELRRRLVANLAAFDGYVGINNHMGSRFTADRQGMAVVLAELSARGLLFLDSRTTAETQAPALGEVYRLPVLSRDVFLDHVQTPKGVAGALAKLEETARREGLAIAIGHPHDVTAAALEAWLPTLEARGLQLIPLSAAVKQNREGW